MSMSTNTRPLAAKLRRLCLCLGLASGAMPNSPSLAAEPLQAQPGERILPLGPAEVFGLQGQAFAIAIPEKGKQPVRRALQKGEKLTHGQRIDTAETADSRLELRFLDGSVVRLGPSTSVNLLSDVRQMALHRGRLLVAGDRMLGSIAVLTRFRSFFAEGTTYVVALEDYDKNLPPRLELIVLEGAVAACPVAPDDTKAVKSKLVPSKNWIVVHGERLEVRLPPAESKPQNDSLTARLKDEPLIAGFSTRLPTFLRIDDLADQQRRGFLTSRNERLRREIFWKRPPRAVKLSPVLADPVIVRYEYPR